MFVRLKSSKTSKSGKSQTTEVNPQIDLDEEISDESSDETSQQQQREEKAQLMDAPISEIGEGDIDPRVNDNGDADCKSPVPDKRPRKTGEARGEKVAVPRSKTDPLTEQQRSDIQLSLQEMESLQRHFRMNPSSSFVVESIDGLISIRNHC